MPGGDSTFGSIVKTIAGALGEVVDDLGDPKTSPQQTLYFLRNLGWNVPEDKDFSNISLDFVSLASAINTELGKDSIDFLGLAAKTKDAISSIDRIGTSLNLGGLGNFNKEFPKQLLDYAIIRYIGYEHPNINTFLLLTGVFDERYVDPAPPSRIGYVKHEIKWGQLGKLLSDPRSIPAVYGWGSGDFDFRLFMETIQYFFNSFDLPTMSYETDSPAAGLLKLVDHSLLVPLVLRQDLQCGIEIYPLRPDDNAGNNWGLAIAPFFTGSTGTEIPIDDFLSVILRSDMKVDKTCGIEMRCLSGIKAFDANSASTTKGSFEAGLALKSDDRILILGSAGASRVEVKEVSLKGGARTESGTDYEIYIEIELKDASIVIKAGDNDSDSFINSLMSDRDLSINFSILVGYSYRRGVYFGGSGGLEVSIPVHQKIGPLEICGVIVAVKLTDDGKIPLELGTTLKGDLGALKATVENLGIRATFGFPDNSKGNLGPVNLDLGFKPPKGVGLSIDAGVIKGGGYLYFDYDKGEYAGALDLVIAGWINAKAIGLINTRMPDGSKGFSLLIIITAEFGTGLQLGYGFVLLGLGGLLGLNRTMNMDSLMQGICTNAIEGIMFPRDVVANAPRIISDLRSFFPPQQGEFLIGPMAKVGWGTPALIRISIGVIIEFPRPGITILGILKIALPEENSPLLVLQVNFIGRLEPDNKRLYFAACLFESHVLCFTIDGGMGLLMAWGDDANFLVSVGGFHPRYNPPPLPFPIPARIAIAVLNYSNARIRFMSYYAVTSNTVQFGSNNELYFGFSACNLSGHNTFDALIQFSPFHFIVQISGEISLKVFGMGLFSIGLHFSLEGPAPWRAAGSGEISFFFFSISVDFDITWGESHDTTLPPIKVLPILTAEFEKPENWSALVPAGNNLLVSLRKLDIASDGLVLHPLGTLQISQKAVPLDLTIDKVGNQKVEDGNKFRVDVITAGLTKADVKEMFAIAQFQEMDGARKLSQSAYQKINSGLAVSVDNADTISSSRMVKRVIRYETVIIDSNYKRFMTLFVNLYSSLFNHLLGGSAVSLSKLSRAQKQQYQPRNEKIVIKPENYVVAYCSTNTMHSAEATFESEAVAEEFIRTLSQSDPATAAQMHVIPATETILTKVVET